MWHAYHLIKKLWIGWTSTVSSMIFALATNNWKMVFFLFFTYVIYFSGYLDKFTKYQKSNIANKFNAKLLYKFICDTILALNFSKTKTYSTTHRIWVEFYDETAVMFSNWFEKNYHRLKRSVFKQKHGRYIYYFRLSSHPIP